MSNEEAIQAISDDIAEMKEELRTFHKELFGNGDYEKSLQYRVQRLEMRTGNVGYVVDKLLTPLITAIVTALVVRALMLGTL